MADYDMDANVAGAPQDESKKISFRFCHEW